MRTLSAALLAEQKKNSYTPAIYVGINGDYYFNDRIISAEQTESTWSHTGTVILDNHDGVFTGVDLKGLPIVSGWGALTTGEEYSETAYQNVMTHDNISQKGKLYTILTTVGIPDMLAMDILDEIYIPDGTKTVKDIIEDVFDGTIDFLGTHPYTVDFDSLDSLIDVYCPGPLSFTQVPGSNRLDFLQGLLGLTKCVAKFTFELDGIHIHILNPVITGTSYDYSYALSASAHKFFLKSYRTRLVTPNYIVVMNQSGTPYAGFAKDDSSYAAKPLHRVYYTDLVSNAQGTAIAEAILHHYQLDCAVGYAEVPMNFGQEIWDYVNITDSRASDARQGNIQSLTRKYTAFKNEYKMSFAFGSPESIYNAYLTNLMVNDIYDMQSIPIEGYTKNQVNLSRIMAGAKKLE